MSDKSALVKKTQSKLKLNKQIIDTLIIKCEWSDCSVELIKKNLTFYKHVTSHLKTIEIGIDEDEEEAYFCGWSSCTFTSQDPKEITRHVKYHAYHAELKALGNYVSETSKLPPCLVASEYHFSFPEEEPPFICLWKSCEENLPGIQEFIDHVYYHIKSLSIKLSSYKCCWQGCQSVFRARDKLLDHIKTHTKHNFIACPHCSHCFANKTKFADHCLTQKPIEEHVHQCDYCLSYHPTERILRKHMAQHINHYKCPFCNMTCNKPSLLCLHIRYMHIDYRSFKCSLCKYTCKGKPELQVHLLKHVKGKFDCPEPDCEYTTTTQLAMRRHMLNHNPARPPGNYCCHLCDKKYASGKDLTKHLAAKHNLKKPPGYCRFMYRLENDGTRRLQTVRLESIEVHDIDEIKELSSGEESDGGCQILNQERESAAPKRITIDVLGDKGQIISSSTVTADNSLPPEDVEVLAVGS